MKTNHISSGLRVHARAGAKDVGAEHLTGDRSRRGLFNRGAMLSRDTSPSTPIADCVLPLTNGGGQFGHAAHEIDSSIKCVHAEIITHRDSLVNTSRVRRASQNVNDWGMDFKDSLKRLRVAARLTQEQLGFSSGLGGQSRIANYESGTREPSLTELAMLARALNVTMGQLLGENEAPSHPVRLSGQMLAESIAALRQISQINGLPYDEVENVDATLAAYDIRIGLPEAPSQAQVIDFGQRVRAILETRGSDGDNKDRSGTGATAGGDDSSQHDRVSKGKTHTTRRKAG